MNEKTLFFLMHFIGMGAMAAGCFISTHLLILGFTAVAINAIIMGVYCNITFK